MKVHAPEFPPEPPPRSVVIDEQGLAWQRHEDRWVAAHANSPGRDWPGLLLTRGPIDIVHVPDADGIPGALFRIEGGAEQGPTPVTRITEDGT